MAGMYVFWAGLCDAGQLLRDYPWLLMLFCRYWLCQEAVRDCVSLVSYFNSLSNLYIFVRDRTAGNVCKCFILIKRF